MVPLLDHQLNTKLHAKNTTYKINIRLCKGIVLQLLHPALILFSNFQSTDIQFSPGVSMGACMQRVPGAQKRLFKQPSVQNIMYVLAQHFKNPALAF